MSDIVVTKEEQLLLMVRHKDKFRNTWWEGSLEVDFGKDYSLSDILILANDEPDTIVRVLKITKDGKIERITDAVLDWAEK